MRLTRIASCILLLMICLGCSVLVILQAMARLDDCEYRAGVPPPWWMDSDNACVERMDNNAGPGMPSPHFLPPSVLLILLHV